MNDLVRSLKKVLCIVIFPFCIIWSIQSCSNARSEFTEEEINKRSYVDALPEVSVSRLESAMFYTEFVSNGILQAQKKAGLRFKVSAVIKDITVKNGARVGKGQTLAVLDDYEFQVQLKHAQIDYDNSLVELKSETIVYGHELMDTLLIDKPKLKYLKIKSGFEKANLALEEAKYRQSQTRLLSPMAGVVANLKSKINNKSNTTDVFCTVLDNGVFEVVFPVLEAEASLLSEGQQVAIFPFSQIDTTTYAGTISEINPSVDKHGMLEVKAITKNKTGKLLDGMNVKVVVRKAFPNQLVIPKEALLLRDGRKVVFTYKPDDSTSYWNYVNVGLENTTSYTITSGLKPEDQVIVKGNLNLAHESKVILNE